MADLNLTDNCNFALNGEEALKHAHKLINAAVTKKKQQMEKEDKKGITPG